MSTDIPVEAKSTSPDAAPVIISKYPLNFHFAINPFLGVQYFIKSYPPALKKTPSPSTVKMQHFITNQLNAGKV